MATERVIALTGQQMEDNHLRASEGKRRTFTKAEIEALDATTWGDSDLLRDDGISFVSDGTSFKAVRSKSGYRCVILGDSFDVRCIPSATNLSSYGIWNLINRLMGQKLEMVNVDAISGTGALRFSGDNSYFERIQAGVFDYAPDFCLIRASVNDSHEFTGQDIIAAYDELFTMINNEGVHIITNTISPSNLHITNGVEYVSGRQEFNTWLLSKASNEFDMIVLDQADPLRLVDDVEARADPVYVIDGTHPDLNGAMRLAKEAVKILAPNFLGASRIDAAGSIGINDASVFCTNPINRGTGGTLFGDTTGHCPDNMQLGIQNVVALTASATTVARGFGKGNWFEVTAEVSASGSQLQYANNPIYVDLNAGVQVGDTISVMAEFAAPAGGSGIFHPFIKVQLADASNNLTATVYDMQANSAHPPIGETDWEMVLRTVKVVIPVGTTKILCQFGWTAGIAGAQTVRYGRQMLINHSRL